MARGHTTRFFVESIPSEGKVSLDREQSRHLHVLRTSQGAHIELFDGISEYTGVFDRWENRTAIIRITSKSEEKGVSGAQIALSVPFPKGRAADFVIQKATELGIAKIIPIKTERSIVDPSKGKLLRAKTIAINACEQSGRTKIPKISEQITVDKLLKTTKEYELCLIADANGKNIKQILENKKPKTVLALVGPEGGFTDEEIEQATASGCIPVRLSNAVLRTETAATVLVSLIFNTLDEGGA